MKNNKVKQTESGEIPEGWGVRKLAEFCDILMGQSPPSTTYNTSKNGLPFFQGRKDFGGKYPTKTIWCSKPARIANSGDVLLSVRAPVGDVNVATEKCCIGRGVSALSIRNNNKEFLYYLLLHNQNRLKQIFESEGTVFGCVTKDGLRDFEVILPVDDREQRAIAKILFDLDEKIELNRQMNKTLEAIGQAIFKRWFVDEADNATDGTLGDILETIESGSRPKGGIDSDLKEGIPSVGAENINGLGVYDYSKTKFVSSEFFNGMRRGIVRDYDVLIYKDGAYIGRKSIFGKGFPYEKCCVNEHVFILRANSDANQFFLYFSLNQEEFKQLNTNSAQPGLNQESMKSLNMSIPNKMKIDKFGELVKPLVDQVFFNCCQIRSLSQIRDSLLPRLISGKIRVI